MRFAVSLCLALAFAPLLAQGPGPDYAARGRAVVENIAAGKTAPVAADFDAQMTASLPPERLTSIWQQISEHVGPYRGIAGVTVSREAARHVAVVECRFGDAVWETLVVFDHQNKIGGLFFRPKAEAAAGPEWSAPAYAQPAKFHETAITVSDGQWQLPGTLTLPDGAGSFPAVVLVHGSGPADQDETIGPNKPFKDLAWGLASEGIAVLRYEKRTQKYGAASAPPGQPLTVNDETVNDARAAVALAAQQKEIDPHHVYLLGHSLGGYLAPRIATGDTKIAGIILLAGSARGLADVIVDQMRYLATVAPGEGGVPAATVASVEASAKQIHDPGLKPTDTITLLGSTIPGAYFLDLRGYDPAATAARLTIPILVLQGGRDYQVTQSDYALWQKALNGHANAHFQFFPSLDHLFMTAPGEGLVTPRDYRLAGHVDPQVLTAISNFVNPKS
jgi:hypothetical protein